MKSSIILPAIPIYAERFVDRVIQAVHPRIGRLVPEAEREDVREIIYQGYRVIYLIQAEVITVLAVFHGSRDLAGGELKPWEVA